MDSMGRYLGVSCRSREVHLALAVDGHLELREPQRLEVPTLFEQTEGLLSFIEDARQVLRAFKPDLLRVVRPAPNVQESYPRLGPKVALETLVRVAAAYEEIPTELAYPTAVRAALGAPRTGTFDAAIDAVLEQPVGKYWNTGRKRAAAAALVPEK
jgi:hypothetical protein